MKRDRYFTGLLRILPASFRERHGEELTALVAQMREALGPRPGAFTLLRFYAVLTWDVLRQARGPRSRSAPEAGGRALTLTHGRRLLWRDVLRQSLASAGRTARHQPGFTAAVVLTLGLGIGANATMYGIVDRLLLQPPAHVVDHEQVRRVVIETRSYFGSGELIMRPYMSYPDYEVLQSHEGISGLAVYNPAWEQTVGRGESVSRALVSEASAAFFPLLGVSPRMGRFFTAEEARPGAPLTAVLSEDYWRRVYGADPDVLGRLIEVAGHSYTIIGVAPARFTGIDLHRTDVWLPLEASFTAVGRDYEPLHQSAGTVVIRLNDGVTADAAEAEANRLVLNARSGLPVVDGTPVRLELWPVLVGRGPDATFDPGRGYQAVTAESSVAVWLSGVSLIVLLIACANVANLLMARGTRRRKEMSVHLALGAGRARLVVQIVLESMLLALGGGLLAVFIAWLGGDFVRSTFLPDIHFPDPVLTSRFLAFSLAAASAAGLAAAAAPAVQGSRADVTRALGDASRGSSGRRSNVRSLLTVAQAAMSVVLLAGAGLFVRSLEAARSVDLGIDVDEVLLAQFVGYEDPETGTEDVLALYEEAIERAAALPGVRSAAASRVVFQGSSNSGRFTLPGRDSVPQHPGGQYRHWISPGYFETLGIEIIAGRPIEASDMVADVPGAVVVSETMARTLWPEGDAIGACMLIELGTGSTQCTTVVGIAEDASRGGFRDVPGFTYYLPQSLGVWYRGLYVRADGEAEDIAAALTAALRSFSSGRVRHVEVRSLEQMLAPEARTWTLGATMFSLFGLLALVLAATGLYSVLAFDVAQRTRELGIRAALGAERSRLLGSVLLHGGRLAVVGVAVGLALTYAAAPYTRELLFGVSPRDPGVLGGVALLLLAVGVLASVVPGLRATAVDPTDALRAE